MSECLITSKYWIDWNTGDH